MFKASAFSLRLLSEAYFIFNGLSSHTVSRNGDIWLPAQYLSIAENFGSLAAYTMGHYGATGIFPMDWEKLVGMSISPPLMFVKSFVFHSQWRLESLLCCCLSYPTYCCTL